MVEEVFGSLARGAQTPEVRADLEYMIRVRTWGEASFEYAHFSDHELAQAICRLGRPKGSSLASIKAAVAHCRAHHSNIENVWKRWPTKPTKLTLAEALWPSLEARIASRHRRRPVPIADVMEEVVELALETRRVRELGPRP